MVGRNSLVPKTDPFRREKRLAILLFVLTCCTVFIVRWSRWQPDSSTGQSPVMASFLFAAALMGILLAHEMGHFGLSVVHRFRISLPWFIPFPFLVGTLGAIIRFRDRPTHRTGLAEMAAFGPISGFFVIIPCVVFWALYEAESAALSQSMQLGTPLVFSLIYFVIHGSFESQLSMYSPLGFAAWIGCLITAMNLLPFGQLDGGHLSFALSPQTARRISFIVTVLLVVSGIFLWLGWLAWACMLHIVGSRHPVDVRQEHRPLQPRAKAAIFCAVLTWVLCFHPVPFTLG